MEIDLRTRTRSRISPVPAGVAFALGVGIHALDQFLSVRAGPIPILVTAPAVATLLSLHLRGATYRRILALVGWGVVGSGGAVLGVYVGIGSYYLPRPMTGVETVLYDFGFFLWFVGSLAAAYALAARANGRKRRAAAVLSGPLVQLLWIPLVLLVVESGLYA